ncbi:hypothetical protein D3C80_1872860 [compost metagenome]
MAQAIDVVQRLGPGMGCLGAVKEAGLDVDDEQGSVRQRWHGDGSVRNVLHSGLTGR